MDNPTKPITPDEHNRDILNKQRSYYIGNTIRALRKEKGWTQKMLAQKVGISHSTISRIEDYSPSRRCSLEVLFKIADALEIELTDLITINATTTYEDEFKNDDLDSENTIDVFGEWESIEDDSADVEASKKQNRKWYESIQWTDTCRQCQRKNRGICRDLACAKLNYDEWGDPIPLYLYYADGNNVEAYLERKRKQKESAREDNY